MNKKTLILRAAECAVKEMMIKGSPECLVFENHEYHIVRWDEVLIGLRELGNSPDTVWIEEVEG